MCNGCVDCLRNIIVKNSFFSKKTIEGIYFSALNVLHVRNKTENEKANARLYVYMWKIIDE